MKTTPLSYHIRAFTLVTLTCLTLLFFLSSKQKNSETKNQDVSIDVTHIEKSSYYSTDTDGDGLKDWEETLWGTDPNKTDTNGDGISDLNEVEHERTLSNQTDTASLPEKKLSKQSEIHTVIQNVAPTMTQQEDPLHALGNILGAIIIQNTMSRSALESKTFLTLISTTSDKMSREEAWVNLSLIAQGYIEAGSDMLRVKSPANESDIILRSLSEAYGEQGKSIRGLLIYREKDDIPTDMYKKNNTYVINTSKVFIHAIDFFTSHKIAFSQGEPGVIFTQ